MALLVQVLLQRETEAVHEQKQRIVASLQVSSVFVFVWLCLTFSKSLMGLLSEEGGAALRGAVHSLFLAARAYDEM